MATWDDVERIAGELPEVAESTSYGNRAWKVRGKTFVWQRPFSKADLKRLGDDVPAGDILAARVDDLGEKEAVLAANPTVMFTIEHFDGYAAVLIQLDAITPALLEDAITDAWLSQAPPALATSYLADRN